MCFSVIQKSDQRLIKLPNVRVCANVNVIFGKKQSFIASCYVSLLDKETLISYMSDVMSSHKV